MAEKKEDYSEYMDNFIESSALYQQIMLRYMEKSEDGQMPLVPDEMTEKMSEIATKLLQDPDTFYEQQIDLYADYAKIWANSLARYTGDEAKPLYEPDAKDKRFKDAEWSDEAIFDFIKQAYLVTTKCAQKSVAQISGEDKAEAAKLEFYTKQILDAMSPSNFAATNPEVIRETINSKGKNLVKGFSNLLEDLEKSKHFLNVSTADDKYFKIGKNIAVTKGRVVYKNQLMELIQYSPTQKENYATPILLIPAWINKYYILDLSPDNSLVKWLLDKGYSVFIISWVNPDKSLAGTQFEDYMKYGTLAALDEICKITGQKEITALGYCLGGTLLSCTLAYLKEKKDNRIKAATFMTTMVDFSDVGEMSVFIDDEHLKRVKEQMEKSGYLEGSQMAMIFNSLRANDLIWSFVVNNYLLGQDPYAFDILYWNADTTRLAAKAHGFYLENMYLKNNLQKAEGIKLLDVDINVRNIDTPCYLMAAVEDHIAPWKTTYKTMQLFKGKNRFVLSGSGHVAGVVNPPAKNKYEYWTNDATETSSDKWLKGAKPKKGSWWSDWDKWNSSHCGKKVPAHKVAKGICDAPGEYVLVKS